MRSAYDAARDNLRRCAVRCKKTYDLRVKKQDIQRGVWVWYYYPRHWTGRSPKWATHYVGTMLVTKVLSPTNVCIQKSKRSNPHVVHVDKLKPCRGITRRSWLDKDESSDEEHEDDHGLPARLGVTQRRTTTYQISLSRPLTGWRDRRSEDG